MIPERNRSRKPQSVRFVAVFSGSPAKRGGGDSVDQPAYFPLFVNLSGKRVAVFGGGTVGLRRAQVLSGFGAQVTVISPAFAGQPDGVQLLCRAYSPGGLISYY